MEADNIAVAQSDFSIVASFYEMINGIEGSWDALKGRSRQQLFEMPKFKVQKNVAAWRHFVFRSHHSLSVKEYTYVIDDRLP